MNQNIPRVIIIGAGIAGLSAGVYGRMNGLSTHIFELHDKPGGLCTAWRRKGYTFDGCIDWLMGSSPAADFHRIWDELGALKGKEIVNREEFLRWEGREGKTFILYTDPDRLEAHMLALAPGDAAPIKEFTNGIRRLTKLRMPIDQPVLLDLARMGFTMLPLLGLMKKYSRITGVEFADHFQDPFLREAISNAWGDLAGMPVFGMMMALAAMAIGDAGYPIGGSLAFARAIEQRYLDLGGQVEYRARVERVLVENGRATGVRLTDGTEHHADFVISAADGHATIFEMLEGKFLDETIRGYYDGGLEPFPPMIQVSLGVNRDFSREPRLVDLPLAEPITIAGRTHQRLGYKHYCHDRTMAPAGKSVLTVSFMSDYEYWKELAKDRPAYETEKERIAKTVIGALGRRFPGLEDQVEVWDVATPMTFERYTANWRASFEGWLITTKSIGLMFGQGMPKTLPGLANFYMIGQWTSPGGGLPPAAKDGRDIIKRICKGLKREFATTIA